MALSMRSRKDNAEAYAKARAEARQERFDEAMRNADGVWDEFFNDSSVSDDTKVAAAELLQTLVAGLARCKSPEEIAQLKKSFSASDQLAQRPELRGLMDVADRLDNPDLATLAKTVRRVSDESLEIRTDGTVVRPRRELPPSDQAPAPREQSAPSQPAPRPQQQPAQPVASQSPAKAPRTSEESPTQPQPATPPAPQPTPPTGSGQKQEKKPGLLKRARARGEKLIAGDNMGNA